MMGYIILGVILLFLLFLLSLKVTLTVAYADELQLWAKLLFVKLKIVPSRDKKLPQSMNAAKANRLKKKRLKKLRKKLEKQRAKEEEKEQKKRDIASGKAKKKKSPEEILDVISLVCNLVTKVVRKFFKHLRIKFARINVKVASEDAATTAVAYGAVSQSINVLLHLLDNVKTVKAPKGKDINVYADFCSEEPEIDIEISFSLRVWHVLHVGIVTLIQLVKYYFRSAKHKDEREDAQDAAAEKSKKGHKV